MVQPKTFAEYVATASAQAGSDAALGKVCGFADGSRIGAARRAQGPRLSELACIRLARYTNDDPLWVLHLAGYGEMADLLAGHVAPPQLTQARNSLQQLKQFIDLALTTTGAGDINGENDRHPQAPRRLGSSMDRKRRKATD